MTDTEKNPLGLVPIGNQEVSPVERDYARDIKKLVADAQALGFDRPATVRPEASLGVQYPVLAPNIPVASPSPQYEVSRLQIIGYLNVVRDSSAPSRRELVVLGQQAPEAALKLIYVPVTEGGQHFTITIGEDVIVDGISPQQAYEEVLEPLLRGRTRFDAFEALSLAYKDRVRLDNQRDLLFYEFNGDRKPDDGSDDPLPTDEEDDVSPKNGPLLLE